jgi:chloride channel protein, CIC family
MTVLEAGKQDLIVAYPDETLHDAIARMLRHNVGRLPVVNPEEPGKILGYLGRASILAARVRHQEDEEIRSRGPIFAFARPSIIDDA